MDPALSVLTPQRIATEAFTDAAAAVVRLDEIYERNSHFLRNCFEAYVNGESLTTRVRATYSLCAPHDLDPCAARFTPLLRFRRRAGRARDHRDAA
jgi:hypothetical protein